MKNLAKNSQLVNYPVHRERKVRKRSVLNQQYKILTFIIVIAKDKSNGIYSYKLQMSKEEEN